MRTSVEIERYIEEMLDLYLNKPHLMDHSPVSLEIYCLSMIDMCLYAKNEEPLLATDWISFAKDEVGCNTDIKIPVSQWMIDNKKITYDKEKADLAALIELLKKFKKHVL